ncbi:hypothetical protein RB195_021097 [Necator americanus]|uniref:Uncharacterized protein n=1 Tax=Necator americanus TaxID=51031 RepID=A0ABR1E9J5_NECAM
MVATLQTTAFTRAALIDMMTKEIRQEATNRTIYHYLTKLDLTCLKDDECTKKFRQRMFINIGLRIKKGVVEEESYVN